jgi:folate-dependent phosphoribosylglycinamide formyltransferase PurN
MANIVVMDTSANHNLNMLLKAQQEQNLKDGLLKLIVSDNANTLALAERNDIPSLVYGADIGPDLPEKLEQEVRPDLIVILNWQQTLNAAFFEKFHQKIVSLHPALPGQFPGTDAVKRAFDAYQKGTIKWSGCNLHYVLPDGKTGKVIRQVVVPVERKDTLERFQDRMRKSEEWVLLKGVKQFLYELRTHNRSKGRK